MRVRKRIAGFCNVTFVLRKRKTKVSLRIWVLLFCVEAAVRYRPVYDLEMIQGSRTSERILIPRTAVRARPLQHLKMPAPARPRARLLVPRASVRTSPLQHLEVPFPRRIRARSFVPRAAVHAHILQHLELPAHRRPQDTCPCSSDSRSRVITAALRASRHALRTCTCLCYTESRPRATSSTPRGVHLSPMPNKGVLDVAGDLSVAGAAPRLNIQGTRHAVREALQSEAPYPPSCRASRGSPLAALRDLLDRQSTQISGSAPRRGGWEGREWHRPRKHRGARVALARASLRTDIRVARH